MKIKSTLITVITLISFQFSIAQNTVESSDKILEKAFEQAKEENKNVFIMFKASWCGWCKKMDASMKDPSIEKYFNSNYIIEHLVVLERKGNSHLENPGSEGLLNKHGGKGQGIPYYLIFDSEGNLLADSKMIKDKPVLKGEGSNIGCPGTGDEIDAFTYKLKETSNLTDKELLAIAERFKQNGNY